MSETINAMRAALDRYAERHPEVRELVDALPADLALTEDWVRRYRSSDAAYGRRSLVLRTLLGDPRLGLSKAGAPPPRFWVDRVVGWWFLNLPMDGTPVSREVTPKHVTAWEGVPDRSDFGALTAALCVVPWRDAVTRGETPAAGWARVAHARCLTVERAVALLPTRSAPEGAWFFRTGTALDLINGLIYIHALFASGRERGRAQNRIPRALSDGFGFPGLSLPHLAMFADVVQLAWHGVIDAAAVKGDWLAVGPSVAEMRALLPHVPPATREAVISALEFLCALWTPKGAWFESRESLRAAGARGGTQDSAMFFHLRHAVRRDGALHRYARYYACADAEAWVAQCSPSWGEHAESVCARLASARESALITPTEVRSFGNLLYVLSAERAWTREAAWPLLTPVARAALGARLPKSTGGGTKHGQRRGSPAGARIGHLPVLEELRALGGRAYVVTPGFSGPLPTDGTVFLPRALACGLTSIPGSVVVRGAATVPFSQNPVEALAEELSGDGYVVQLLPSRRVSPG